MRFLFQQWRLWIAAISCLLSVEVFAAKPVLLVSLKPLALIAQEVAGDKAAVETLIPATASHHDYPLKASDYARLNKADLVIWVGPELESFLQKPLKNLPATKLITTYDLPGMAWPPVVDSDHSHEHDPHLWLDPRNAVLVAKAIAANLTQLDAANADIYKANASKFEQRIKTLDKELAEKLKPVQGRGFAVYHEGYSHFVNHYGLKQLNYVTFTPEQKPGAKHLHQLRKDLGKEGVCLFLEPYNDMQSMHELAAELHLRLGTLDAMGGESVTRYEQLLQQMAGAFLTCLAHGGSQ